MAKIRISELPYLASASAGAVLTIVDNGTTYKTDLNVLETAMIYVISASIDNRLDFLESFSASFPSFSSSIDTKIAAATNEQNLSFLVTTSSYNTDSASFDNRLDALENNIDDDSMYLTTASAALFGYHFPNAGDICTYIVKDDTNSKVYRIIHIIGGGYNNNFISIERLY